MDAEHKRSTIPHCPPAAFSRSNQIKTARFGSALKAALYVSMMASF